MQTSYHTVTITIFERGESFRSVGELLHQFSDKITLRVGYPVPESDTSVIFIIVKATSDELGALSGKLGQLKNVKVKSANLKI